MAKKKTEKSYAKKLLPWIIVAVVVYTIGGFALQALAHESIDPTLTQMYFAFWCIEILNIANIKVNKVKASKSSNTKSIIKDAVDSILSDGESESEQ